MQKNWLRVFLLCVACAVCLHGNCSAERWVQYFISFGDKIFMDIDSIKAWEYKGRKYLGAYVKGNLVASISKELYVLVDLENERKLELNKSCILNGQIDDHYFDILINTPRNKKIVSPQEYVVLSHGKLPVEKAFMQCAEQNRPDVINEILAYNTSGAVSQGAPSVGAQTGDLTIPPTTLPMDDSNEVYDLTQMRVRYVSQGYYGAGESTFVLSYEKSADTANIGKVVPTAKPHGAYLMKNDIHIPLMDDFSFDYDEASQTFTIYDGGGKEYTIRYDQAANTMIVNHLWDGARRSGTYVYDATVPGYKMNASNQTIRPHVATLVTEFHGEGEYDVPYRNNGIVFEVVPYSEENFDHNGLPDMWYKMTDENNSNEWEAFTYDITSGMFSCYYDNQGEIKHVYRKFLDGNQLGMWEIGEDLNGPLVPQKCEKQMGFFGMEMQGLTNISRMGC